MKATFHFQVLMYYKATIIQYSTITITDRQLKQKNSEQLPSI